MSQDLQSFPLKTTQPQQISKIKILPLGTLLNALLLFGIPLLGSFMRDFVPQSCSSLLDLFCNYVDVISTIILGITAFYLSGKLLKTLGVNHAYKIIVLNLLFVTLVTELIISPLILQLNFDLVQLGIFQVGMQLLAGIPGFYLAYIVCTRLGKRSIISIMIITALLVVAVNLLYVHLWESH